MSRRVSMLLALVAFAAGGGGYWIGRHDPSTPPMFSPVAAEASSAEAADDPIAYYRDPNGKPLYSLEPQRTSDGRPWRAVHASEEVGGDRKATAASQPTNRKIRYYRNPMGLPDISKVPKKDSMGMDYIPVYEGEDNDGTTVTLTSGKLQRTGVRTEPAALRAIAEPVRAPGSIQLDERRVAVISLRAEAYVESVANVTTGDAVRAGQALMRLYSPAITGATSELATSANDGTGTRGVRQRLLNLGAPAELIAEVERTRNVPLTFTLPAPRDGLVLERNVVEGQRVMPGDVLFRLADETAVWALVDVAERDIASVKQGQAVTVRVRGYRQTFSGKVALVYPYLNAATRTVRVRIELSNSDLILKPDMYVEAEIDTGSGRPVLSVPDSAVIDSGDRQLVIVEVGEGRFEPRPVQIGRRGGGYVEIRDGLAAHDNVVTSANFLIDAESNLQSALNGLAADGGAK